MTFEKLATTCSGKRMTRYEPSLIPQSRKDGELAWRRRVEKASPFSTLCNARAVVEQKRSKKGGRFIFCPCPS